MTPMDDVTERGTIDKELGALREQLRAAGPDWTKVNRIQERIAELQKHKDRLLGITD
jgi:hypothetical protein